ncbi:unnamed protein product [Camellia sinensis]
MLMNPLVAPNRRVLSGTLMKSSRKQELRLSESVVTTPHRTRLLRRKTDFRSHCSAMRVTRSEKSGACHRICLEHCPEDRPTFLTRVGWFNLSTTTSSNPKNTSMKP